MREQRMSWIGWTGWIWVLCMLVAVRAEPVQAQFEGEIFYLVEEFRDGLPAERTYHLQASAERLSFRSSHSHRLMRGLSANRFLVRNDLRDLIVINHADESFQMTGEEAEAMAQLLRQMKGSNEAPVNWAERVRETGRETEIQGMRAVEMEVVHPEKPLIVSVWLTSDIQIAWGYLEALWRQSLSGVLDMEVPLEVFMNQRSVPLRVEYHENGELTTRIEAVRVREGALGSSQFEVPAGVTPIGMSDIMLRIMRGS